MSITTHSSMTNHHAPSALSGFARLLRTWRERQQQRRELAHWAERDVHDAGLSMTDVMAEAEKPFWRA